MPSLEYRPSKAMFSTLALILLTLYVFACLGVEA